MPATIPTYGGDVPWPGEFTSGPSGDLPVDFLAALINWLRADATLAAAFPGSFVHAMAAARQEFPYGRVSQVSYHDDPSGDDREFSVTVSAYAYGSDAARQAAELVSARLEDSDTRPPLRWAGWVEAARTTNGPEDPLRVADGRNGVEVFRCDVPYRFYATSAPEA